MAVRLGNNKWNSGDYFYSDDFNDTFSYGGRLIQIITPTTLKIEQYRLKSAEFTVSELFNINPSFGLTDFDYLLFVIQIHTRSYTAFANSVTDYITIQTAPTNGTLSDSLPKTEVYKIFSYDASINSTLYNIFTHVHTLTEAEKTSGLDLNIILDSITSGTQGAITVVFEIKKIFVYGLKL